MSERVFLVRLLLMNTSGIFTLTDVTAEIAFPAGGLTSILQKDGVISFRIGRLVLRGP